MTISTDEAPKHGVNSRTKKMTQIKMVPIFLIHGYALMYKKGTKENSFKFQMPKKKKKEKFGMNNLWYHLLVL